MKVSKGIKIKIENFNDLDKYPGNVPELHHEHNSIFSYTVDEDFIRDYKMYLNLAQRDNFTSLLIQLISKADAKNLISLSYLYPSECLTIWMYQNIDEFHKQLELK